MPGMYTLLEPRGLGGQSHGPEFDVRYAGSCAYPHAGGPIGGELPYIVVRQVPLSGEILVPIARRCFRIDPDQPLRRFVPNRAIGGYGDR